MDPKMLRQFCLKHCKASVCKFNDTIKTLYQDYIIPYTGRRYESNVKNNSNNTNNICQFNCIFKILFYFQFMILTFIFLFI